MEGIVNHPEVQLTSMPQLAEAVEPDDDWTGLTDAAARRKRQNRLNVRAHRRRKAQAAALAVQVAAVPAAVAVPTSSSSRQPPPPTTTTTMRGSPTMDLTLRPSIQALTAFPAPSASGIEALVHVSVRLNQEAALLRSASRSSTTRPRRLGDSTDGFDAFERRQHALLAASSSRQRDGGGGGPGGGIDGDGNGDDDDAPPLPPWARGLPSRTYFPLTLDHLIPLVHYNVLRAVFTNIMILRMADLTPSVCHHVFAVAPLFPIGAGGRGGSPESSSSSEDELLSSQLAAANSSVGEARRRYRDASPFRPAAAAGPASSSTNDTPRLHSATPGLQHVPMIIAQHSFPSSSSSPHPSSSSGPFRSGPPPPHLQHHHPASAAPPAAPSPSVASPAAAFVIPSSLAPTALQLSTPHDMWVAVLPHARMRDNAIRRAGQFDAAALCREMVGKQIYDGKVAEAPREVLDLTPTQSPPPPPPPTMTTTAAGVADASGKGMDAAGSDGGDSAAGGSGGRRARVVGGHVVYVGSCMPSEGELGVGYRGDELEPSGGGGSVVGPSSSSSSAAAAGSSQGQQVDDADANDDAHVGRGVIAWSDPWRHEGWELTEGFVRRWRILLEGCQEMVDSTNRWRALRGEDPIVLDLGP